MVVGYEGKENMIQQLETGSEGMSMLDNSAVGGKGNSVAENEWWETWDFELEQPKTDAS